MSDSNPKGNATQEFKYFDQQLDELESLLHITNEYNNQLNIHLDNLQKLVKDNECTVNHLQFNGQRIDSLLKGAVDQNQTVNQIKEQLSLPAFNCPKARAECGRKNYSQCSISQQLRDLGNKVNAIGTKFQMLRNTALRIKHVAKDHEARPGGRDCGVPNKRQICWMPSNDLTKGQSQTKELSELQKETLAVFCFLKNQRKHRAVLTLPNFTNQNQLIDRVKDILATAERLSLNSIIFTDVKALCKMVLEALYNRSKVYQMYSNKNPYL